MKNVKIRRVNNSDMEDIFKWRNHEHNRKMARNANKVKWSDHVNWFEKSLKNSKKSFYLCLDEKDLDKIGMVRFDFNDDDFNAEISINLNPKMFGMGYAKNCLRAGIQLMREEKRNCKLIIAQIKDINIPSIKSFLGVGFIKNKVNTCDLDIYIKVIG